MSRFGSDLAARAAWQRWQMDSLETLKPRAAAGADEADSAGANCLRQRIEALSQAREQGHSKGHAAGFEQGRREGHAEGLARGLEEGRRQGFEAGEREGRTLGLRAGRDAGAEAVREQARRLQALADACEQSLNTLEAEVGQSLIALAVRIAEQVLRRSLQDHPNQVLDLVDEVLQTRPAPEATVQLRLHPEDLDLLRESIEQDAGSLRPHLIAAAHISRGGCILETDQGTIDATLETRWRRVIGALGHPPGKP
uniref:flagellar assembly protein FliH n=1 Tax=Castellaniella defragrans TaxID=75697 RepID=UPI0033425516